eukprot:Lithocolla_globosa_v1_NODE_1400_length_2608_cov_3.206032.p2 type:complete len:160 gc:universal NODE_1400_length_2608_cov_3.206032:1334-855(-)
MMTVPHLVLFIMIMPWENANPVNKIVPHVPLRQHALNAHSIIFYFPMMEHATLIVVLLGISTTMPTLVYVHLYLVLITVSNVQPKVNVKHVNKVGLFGTVNAIQIVLSGECMRSQVVVNRVLQIASHVIIPTLVTLVSQASPSTKTRPASQIVVTWETR